VKTKKQNINVRKLFSENLGKTEVIPDASVKLKLMHRVARREFLRFNPSRFNIYYTSGLVISVIVGILLLSPFSAKVDKLSLPETRDSLFKSDTGKYLEISIEQPVIKETEKSGLTNHNSKRNNAVLKELHNSVPGNSKVSDSVKSKLSLVPGITNSLSNKGIFPEVTADKQKLQSGYKPDALLIEPKAFVGCAPLKVRFRNKSTSYDSCMWTFGDGGFSNKRDPEWIFDVEGDYKVVLNVYTANGNYLRSSAVVTVHPRPKAHFEIFPEKAVLPDDEISFMNFSTNAVKSIWDFGDGTSSGSYEPRHTYSRFANYNVRLVVYSDWGCSDSLTVLNAFSGSEYFIDFPNAFIPNAQGPSGGFYSPKSDEAAQVFHPSFSGVTDYQLKIFSKLGILIFESNDINLGWDGYNKGQLCEPGVYIWKVRGKFRNGEPFIKMGDVTLLKN
jgi:PKD repeat protein